MNKKTTNSSFFKFQSVDTRRQAALHRLLCMEENFVDLMHQGVQKFSRPLRHCILSSPQHETLFQNIEKVIFLCFYHSSSPFLHAWAW